MIKINQTIHITLGITVALLALFATGSIPLGIPTIWIPYITSWAHWLILIWLILVQFIQPVPNLPPLPTPKI